MYWHSITTLSLAQVRILPAPELTQLLNAFCVQLYTAPQLTEVPMGYKNPSTAPWSAPSQPTTPGPVPGPSPGPGGNPPCSRVQNPSTILDIQIEMEGRTFKLRSLLTYGVRTPHNSKGEICLSYHCRLSCFTDFTRRGYHQTLTFQDKTDMCHWVRDNVITPNVGKNLRLLHEVTICQLSPPTLILGLTSFLFLPFLLLPLMERWIN